MVILRDKIRFYEGIVAFILHKVGLATIFSRRFSLTFAGQKLLDSLAETWDFFFCDVLSMLQAIFHPVQVRSRQRSLLVLSLSSSHFCFFFFSSGEGSLRQTAGSASFQEHHSPEREAGRCPVSATGPRAPLCYTDAAYSAGERADDVLHLCIKTEHDKKIK